MADEPGRADAASRGRDVSMSPIYAAGFGALAAVYGGLLALLTWLYWASLTPPGTVIGPSTFVQSLALRIDQGIYLLVLGAVLLVGGGFLYFGDRRVSGQPVHAPETPRWRAPTLAAAVLLVFAVFFVGILAPPQRTLEFTPQDFQLAPASANGNFEFYFVSSPFVASGGEDFFPWFDVALRENATGAIVEQDNGSSSYVKGLSDSYGIPQFAGGFVAQTTGSYVAVVRSSFCETLASPPCSNATVEVTGFVRVESPTAYLPVQAILGVVSATAVVASWAQSGFGRRRTTS